MATLYIPKVNIPTTLGYVWEATSWYLATDPSLDDDSIVMKSEEDTENLKSIYFDYELSPDVTYYYKAVIICNKAIIETNVNVIHTTDQIEITERHPIPSAVMPPVLTMGNSTEDGNLVPNSLFSISTSDINTTSNSKLEYTTYLIETTDGRAVVSYINDNDNLTYKLFDDVILKENTPYVLKVAHHSSSGDMSPFASIPFITYDTRPINLTTTAEDIDKKAGMGVAISPIDDYDEMTVTLYAAGLGDAKLVYTSTTGHYTKSIPSEYFDSLTTKFILGIEVKLNDGTTIGPKYYEVTTMN